ncbi:MAG: hypothetical protein WCC22_11915 [Terriglobales bacterium]
MRSVSLFALILAGLTLTTTAQDYKTPKAKPYHSESKEKQSKTGGTNKQLTPQAANSLELRRLEAQTAKVSASNKGAKQQARSARVVKTERDKPNPPIRFSSATGTHAGMTDQGKNPYKGRVRQKGNNSH